MLCNKHMLWTTQKHPAANPTDTYQARLGGVCVAYSYLWKKSQLIQQNTIHKRGAGNPQEKTKISKNQNRAWME